MITDIGQLFQIKSSKIDSTFNQLKVGLITIIEFKNILP
jgi:hypothetical protein